MDITKMDFSPTLSYEEYKERYKKHYAISRDDKGVIEVRMAAEDGGETMWLMEHKNSWHLLLQTVGADKENEVLILGGTGEHWCLSMDPEYGKKVSEAANESPETFSKFMLDTYQVVPHVFEALLYDVDIPTIGVINGPCDGHMELALMCDIVLCAPDVEFSEIHFNHYAVPGDGMFAILQKVIGPARANYLAYSGEGFTAQQALEWGLISEIVPTENIYKRAHEIADGMMKASRSTRCLTHDLARKPWREMNETLMRYHALAESFGGYINWGSAQ